MSLLVWLPLNGNLNNQGILVPTITNKGATVSSSGKIGKSYSFDGTDDYMYLSSTMPTYQKEWTICCWVNVTTTASACLYTQRNAISSSGRAIIFSNGTIAFDNGGRWQPTITITSGSWDHYAFVYSYKGGRKIYKNGELVASTTDVGDCNSSVLGATATIGATQSADSSSVSGNYFKGNLNDFRIYDSCLSQREIKEISKGLILHYPLKSQHETGQQNLYTGVYSRGKALSASNSYTITENSDGEGYNYAFSYTGTGSNAWPSFAFPTFSFTAGKTYMWYMKVRVNSSSNYSLVARNSRIGNDWESSFATIVSSSLVGQGWKEYYGFKTLEAKSTRSGTEYTTSPLLECYPPSLSVSGTVYSANFDIKDVMILETASYVPYINTAMISNVIDTSGFGNNGTNGGTITYTNSSPRNGGSYYFDSTGYIACGTGAKVTDAITVNIWMYESTWSSTNPTPFSCTESGGWNLESSSGYINFPLYANGSYRSCTSSKTWASLSSGWHMFTITYNGLTCCLYIDGVIDTTITPFTTKYPITYHESNGIFVHGEASGTTTAPGTISNPSNLSDFRIYATALSANDVKELYNVPISISNNGTLMTQGEVIES